MTKVALVAGGVLDTLLPTDADLYIGADAGCLTILKAGLPLAMAVGDFDSVTAEALQFIKTHAQRFVAAPAEKDDTDLELALKETLSIWPQADIRIYGALGGRLDHSLSNIFLPSHPDLFPFMQQFQLVDSHNLLTFYPAGRHFIEPQLTYPYVAFMLEGSGRLAICGAKYELGTEHYFKRKIYSSNAFLERPIEVRVPSGYLAVIYSKDR